MKKRKKLLSVFIVMGLLLSQLLCGFVVEAASGKWGKDKRGYYYTYSDGSYAKNAWIQTNGKWYYIDKNGYMAVAWKKIGAKWYYFGSNGKMKTGWQQISSKWYYFGVSGAMSTGWKEISGKWYYFNASGEMLKDQYIGAYYLGSDGAMQETKNSSGGKASGSDEGKSSASSEDKSSGSTGNSSSGGFSETATYTFILNINTRRVHLPGCSSVTQMKAKNRKEYKGTLADLKGQGYDPCDRCLCE